jgi:hypothetical protein
LYVFVGVRLAVGTITLIAPSGEHEQDNSAWFRDKSSILKRAAADVRRSYQMTCHDSKFARKQEEAMRG